jgi:transcriptional antiterminator RfaH
MGLTVAKPCPDAVPINSGLGGESHASWLAAYTRPRHEAAVARQLEAKEVTYLLPTYVRRSRWSDRMQAVVEPLFPSYVFVNVSHDEQLRVLQTAGVIHLVSVAGRPAPLRDEDVTMLRACAARARELEPHPFLSIGQKVRVTRGPFLGWEGVLAKRKNSQRLVITLEQIMRSVSVDLADADVEALN